MAALNRRRLFKVSCEEAISVIGKSLALPGDAWQTEGAGSARGSSAMSLRAAQISDAGDVSPLPTYLPTHRQEAVFRITRFTDTTQGSANDGPRVQPGGCFRERLLAGIAGKVEIQLLLRRPRWRSSARSNSLKFEKGKSGDSRSLSSSLR